MKACDWLSEGSGEQTILHAAVASPGNRGPIWTCAELLLIGSRCAGDRGTALGLRQVGLPRQPTALALQGKVVRLSLALLRSALLHHAPLRLPARIWPFLRRSVGTCADHRPGRQAPADAG